MVNLNYFKKECECIYKDEHYSVRDNGSILRWQKSNKRMRPLDEKWTFGKPCKQKGYMNFSSETVHRIVATAFHGKQPSEKHIVDHIDTNKKNNRPDNLRWITRLENILLNPITAKRIEYICGSVEAFLDNPSQFRDKFENPDYKWMATVSAEEAKTSLQRLQKWAKSDKKSSNNNSLDKWIFSREIALIPPGTDPNYLKSKTPNAGQLIITPYDKPNEFPCTPQAFEGEPLTAYYEVLNEGAVFFRNHNGEYVVVKRGFSKDRNALYVMTKSAYVWRERGKGEYIPVPIAELSEEDSCENLPHSLTEINYEYGLFVHKKMEMGFHPTEELEKIFVEYTQVES